MQKITPFLWFNDQAEEAVKFYASAFKNSKVGDASRYDEEGAKVSGQKEGGVMTVNFTLAGQEFIALNGGPMFTFTPAISFFVSCQTEEEIDALWAKLSEGGKVMMEFQKYPFSPKYGWLADKYGVSWQLNLADCEQKIAPCLMFVGDVCGKAEEAMNFYTSLFKDSGINVIARYEKGEGDTEGNVKYSVFSLNGQDFMAMDSGFKHAFDFSLATSFMVTCDTQGEVDHFWNKLSAYPEAEQCGWLKDKYGVSWQIVPKIFFELVSDPKKAEKVMKAVFTMKKIDGEILKNL